jgi:hypothetical protein
MSVKIKYTVAEQRSFLLIPETCPVVDRAFDSARGWEAIDREAALRSFKIEPTPMLMAAIRDIIDREKFGAHLDAKNLILHEATFPLRLALVRQVESRMRDIGEVVEDRSNYAAWIESWQLRKRLREEDARSQISVVPPQQTA